MKIELLFDTKKSTEIVEMESDTESTSNASSESNNISVRSDTDLPPPPPLRSSTMIELINYVDMIKSRGVLGPAELYYLNQVERRIKVRQNYQDKKEKGLIKTAKKLTDEELKNKIEELKNINRKERTIEQATELRKLSFRYSQRQVRKRAKESRSTSSNSPKQ